MRKYLIFALIFFSLNYITLFSETSEISETKETTPVISAEIREMEKEAFELIFSKTKQPDYEKALEIFDKILKIDNRYMNAYYQKAIIFIQMSNYEKALENYDIIIANIKNNFKLFYERGTINAVLGKKEKAVSDFSDSIKLNIYAIDAYYSRGSIFLADKKYETALSDFSKVIEINPAHIEAYNLAALCYYMLGEFVKVEIIYSLLIDEFGQKQAEIYNNRADVYKKLKKYKRAESDISKAIKINPKYPVAYATAAEIAAEQKQFEKAMKYIKKMIEIDPDSKELLSDPSLDELRKTEEFQELFELK